MLRQLRKLYTLKSYMANLHTTTLRCEEGKTEVMKDKHMSKIRTMLDKYTPDQEEKILKIVNTYGLNELLGYEISRTKANKLLAWRERYGLLGSLNDLFAVEGFSIGIAQKFFQSLLQETTSNETKLAKSRVKTAPFVAPAVEAEQRKTIKSTVAVRIGVNSVTWSRLELPEQHISAPCLLTHWQHHEISDKKLHINDLIQRCLYIHHLIPAADCYLFENPQMAQAVNNPGRVEQQNINIQKSQVIAMMGYALTSRKHRLDDGMSNEVTHVNGNTHPNVFYVRRFLSARLFNHLVDKERVSSEETILDMMRTFYNIDERQDFLPEEYPDAKSPLIEKSETFSGLVQFPMELREMFSKAPRYYREFLGQSLLLNLTFIRLVLLQDAKSIAKVSRGSNSEANKINVVKKV